MRANTHPAVKLRNPAELCTRALLLPSVHSAYKLLQASEAALMLQRVCSQLILLALMSQTATRRRENIHPKVLKPATIQYFTELLLGTNSLAQVPRWICRC